MSDAPSASRALTFDQTILWHTGRMPDEAELSVRQALDDLNLIKKRAELDGKSRPFLITFLNRRLPHEAMVPAERCERSRLTTRERAK